MTKRIIILAFAMMMMVCTAQAQTMRVTAYSYESGSITASGEYVHEGGCACNDVPLGTTIYVSGRPYVVNDRMANSGCVDIWMSDTEECLNWGVQYLDVEW